MDNKKKVRSYKDQASSKTANGLKISCLFISPEPKSSISNLDGSGKNKKENEFVTFRDIDGEINAMRLELYYRVMQNPLNNGWHAKPDWNRTISNVDVENRYCDCKCKKGD